MDTPEEKLTYATRIAEQAAYFGISPEAAIEVGHQASEFTEQMLAKPFTIQTRWRLALGRSILPRYYAIVLTADGHDLNELLVSAGLARIYGTRTPLPAQVRRIFIDSEWRPRQSRGVRAVVGN